VSSCLKCGPSPGQAGILVLLWSILLSTALAQQNAREWERLDGTSVIGEPVDLKGNLLTLSVGRSTAQVMVDSLSSQSRNNVYSWLRYAVASPSSKFLRPTLKHELIQQKRGTNFIINGSQVTVNVGYIESEIIVPFFYDAPKLRFRLLNEAEVTRKEVKDPEAGEKLMLPPLPRETYFAALSKMDKAEGCASLPLKWNEDGTLPQESKDQLEAVTSAMESFKQLNAVEKILRDRSEREDSDSRVTIDNLCRVGPARTEQWSAVFPQTSNKMKIKASIERVEKSLQVANDQNQGQGVRQLKWKSILEDWLPLAQLVRSWTLPEHPWSLPLEKFRMRSESFLELSDGVVIYFEKSFKAPAP